MLDRTTLVAWAAGFVDGESSICLAFGRHQQQIALTVQVAQNVETPLLLLHQLFGGSVKQYDRGRKTLQHVWRIHSGKAAAALREMRPWLQVKDEHADLAIAFWDCGRAPRWNAKRETGRALRLTEADRLVRLDFYRRMQALQHKGIHRRRPIAV